MYDGRCRGMQKGLVACRQWHRNQDNQLVTADAVYIVRDPQLCPNKANSWPLVSTGLTMSSMAAPAPAGNRACTYVFMMSHHTLVGCHACAVWQNNSTHLPIFIGHAHASGSVWSDQNLCLMDVCCRCHGDQRSHIWMIAFRHRSCARMYCLWLEAQ